MSLRSYHMALVGLMCVGFFAVKARGEDVDSPRIVRSIDSGWKFTRSDARGAETENFDDSQWLSINLPYNWNVDKTRDRVTYYRGPAWYRYHLMVGRDLTGKSLFLRFGAAGLVTRVYLDSQLVGTHAGAFGAFCFEITHFCHSGDNVIAVRADNSYNPNVPPLSGDFTLYGGLYRDVELLALSPVSISPLDDASPGVYLTTQVTDASANVQITSKLRNATQRPANVTVVTTIADAAGYVVKRGTTYQTIAASSTADSVEGLTLANPHLWNGRRDPYLYQSIVEVFTDGRLVDRVAQPLGLRYFRVDPDDGLFLNGKPYDMHGVDYHEGRTSVGFADTHAMEEQDNRIICDMGCTGVRMAHYQHNDYEYTLCDRSGLIVWTELALVNKMTDTPQFRQNTKQQLRELIKQEYNHPSIFFWSMYNEPWVGRDSGTQEQWRLISDLVSLAHQLDDTRLTTGAVVMGVQGPIDWYMDVTGMNRYPGWYDGPPEKWVQAIADLHHQNLGKCIGISEYGAGASIYQHEANLVHPVPASHWHPEEWQGIVHEHAWAAMKDQRWLWCKLVWCMFDFSSSGRNEGDRPGINDKGLVTADRKIMKDAYFFYKACWNPEPFVYITDRRFNPRPSGPADLKVYSNCDSVQLTINGQPLDVKKSESHVFAWPNVPLTQGDDLIQAVGAFNGKNYQDSIIWKVAAASPEPTNPIPLDSARSN
jgi:beta-galactosidase